MPKVAVAMSGGVDSSVAAALLKERGYAVMGVAMKIWGGETLFKEGIRHGCYGPGEEEDIEDARKVAQALEIPFYAFDLKEEYRGEVLDYFRREYLAGRTPNPCVRCNRRIKFDALVRKTRSSGLEFDYFATGHYSRVEYDEEKRRFLLQKAKDMRKDQSYFLYSLSQEQLEHTLFPLGNYTKEEVREIARYFGLAVHDKPESQDFTAGAYSSLVESAAQSGPIFDKYKNILATHRGVQFYTIGQRKGLGISSGQPLYVTAIDCERNTVVVGPREELFRDKLVASELNWIAIEKLENPTEMKARVRYHHKEAEALVTPLDEGRVHVKFEEPQMAIAPGQAAVFYQGDVVIGGGTIERTER